MDIISDDENNTDHMSLDKNNVFKDSAGLQLNEREQDLGETMGGGSGCRNARK